MPISVLSILPGACPGITNSARETSFVHEAILNSLFFFSSQIAACNHEDLDKLLVLEIEGQEEFTI